MDQHLTLALVIVWGIVLATLVLAMREALAKALVLRDALTLVLEEVKRKAPKLLEVVALACFVMILVL